MKRVLRFFFVVVNQSKNGKRRIETQKRAHVAEFDCTSIIALQPPEKGNAVRKQFGAHFIIGSNKGNCGNKMPLY